MAVARTAVLSRYRMLSVDVVREKNSGSIKSRRNVDGVGCCASINP